MSTAPETRTLPWIALLAAAAGIWLLDAHNRWTAREAAAHYAPARAVPADASQPSGLVGNQRSGLIDSVDGLHWVMQAQQARLAADPRVRRVDYDNAPAGREVHWAWPLRGWLRLVGGADAWLSGRPAALAIESAGAHAGAWLLLLLAIPTFLVFRAPLGLPAAALLATGMLLVVPFSAEFSVGTIDHHGLAGWCALMTVAAAGCGLRAVDAAAARRWMAGSALAGAGGMWISAATQIPVLAGLGLGTMAAAWSSRGVQPTAEAAPPWRMWGFVGGLASLACYLAEYFPSTLGWRLEVNHPLYALAWAGAGDLLDRVGRWLRGDAGAMSSKDRLLGIAAAAAVLATPLVLLLGGSSVFHVSDPLLWALHTDYIDEFDSLASVVTAGASPWWDTLLLRVNLLPVVGLVIAALALRRAQAPSVRAMLALVLAPALVATVMALAQKRWLPLAAALWLATTAAAISTAEGRPRRWWMAALALVILGPFPLRVAATTIALRRDGPEVGPDTVRELAVRDAAQWLRRRAAADAVVVLSDPTSTSQLIYHGGLRGIGTLYWENLDGLGEAIRIAGGTSPEEALRLIRHHGVTHIVHFSWRPFAEESARLAQGLRAGQPAPAGAFLLGVLERGESPAWLRPLPYRLPKQAYLDTQRAVILEVVPDQPPADALVHQARYLQAFGDTAGARRLVAAVLERQPGHLPALATAAQMELAARRAPEFGALMSRIRPLLPGAELREPEDRILLALCLAAAGQHAQSAEQLRAAWSVADERVLRRLPPGSLRLLVRLSDEHAVAPADAARLVAARRMLHLPP